MILMWGVLGLVNESQAANIYVDQTLSSDCTSGTYSIANRNCNGADGRAYNTIQEAVNAMNGGDDIYIRGGTYTLGSGGTEGVTHIGLENAPDGTAENKCSLQSYPGEWAIIDGNDNQLKNEACVGDIYDDSYNIAYWIFERFEITDCSFSGGSYGMVVNGRNNAFRYLYFHDITTNLACTVADNPAALIFCTTGEVLLL